jgi:acyl carrier protein
MTEDDVLHEVRRIARDELDLEGDVDLDVPVAGSLDSLSMTVLAVGLEDRFQIRLREEDANVATLRDLARLVARRVAETPEAT